MSPGLQLALALTGQHSSASASDSIASPDLEDAQRLDSNERLRHSLLYQPCVSSPLSHQSVTDKQRV